MAKLIVEAGSGPKVTYQLGEKRITVGRDASNQIVLRDSSVSRIHSEIVPTNGHYRIADLNSTNGVFVNNARIEQKHLEHGDKVRLGNTVLIFVEKEDAPVSAAAEPMPYSEISMPMFAIKALEDVEQDYERVVGGEEAPKDSTGTAIGKDQRLLFAFYKLSQVLGSDKDLGEVLKDALMRILDIVRADTGMVFLVNAHSGALEPFLAVRGHETIPFDQLNYSNTVMKKALESKEAILTSDAMTDARFSDALSIVAGNIHSAMCVPLITPKNVFGVIQVDSRSRCEGFRKDHLEVLSIMAKEIAVYLENKKLGEALKEELDRLLSVDKIKSKFITVLGHHLATPVAVIDQYLQLFKEGMLGPIDPGKKDALDIFERNVQRLRDLAHDVQRITSWETIWEKLKSSMEEFDIQDCLEGVLEELKTLLQTKRQKIAWSRSAQPIRLEAHKESIREVLLHFLVNAYKFAPPGSKITVEIKDNRDTIVAKVEDNGMGMTPEIVRQLFESFYVADENLIGAMPGTPKRLSKGLGLGLATCRQIVEGHKGKVWAESEVGKGSRFYFTLPKRQRKE